MRTETIMDENMQEWTIRRNGDFEGDLDFAVFPNRVEYNDQDTHRGTPPRYHVQIPIKVVLELAGRYLQARETGKLEDEMGVAYLNRLTGHTS